ncbi:MAG: prepilin-type N-terminal cleavage/methylation domain-containing protein [Clostridia bacterium]|nr:prepilin-type N-terminal cleavage/methylation domain-containing protein [Clostridia bacterium]
MRPLLFVRSIFCKLTIRTLSTDDKIPCQWERAMVCRTDLKSGFTLIELVVVMAILSVLAAIAVMLVPAMTEKARVATDRQNIAVLNTATQHYLFNATSPNAFEVVSETSDSRMKKLIEAGLLTELVTPQQKNKVFEWSLLDQTWQMAASLPESGATLLADPEEEPDGSSEPLEEEPSDGEFGLGLDDKSSFITTYTGSGSIIEIPGSINGVTVTGIAAGVFQGKGLTEITLPGSVKTIDATAFLGNSIIKITIGTGVSIAGKAFSGSDKFIKTYSATGSAAGTYVYEKGEWAKE